MRHPMQHSLSLSKRGIDCDLDYLHKKNGHRFGHYRDSSVILFTSQFTPSICIDNRLNFVTNDITNNVNHCMQIPNRQSQARKPRRTITKQHVYGGGGVGGGGGCGTFWSLWMNATSTPTPLHCALQRRRCSGFIAGQSMSNWTRVSWIYQSSHHIHSSVIWTNATVL